MQPAPLFYVAAEHRNVRSLSGAHSGRQLAPGTRLLACLIYHFIHYSTVLAAAAAGGGGGGRYGAVR
jgi:hypothetical protein